MSDTLAAPQSAPARSPELDGSTTEEAWYELAWRPAGSMSLSERWLRAGAPFPAERKAAPSKNPQRSRKSRVR